MVVDPEFIFIDRKGNPTNEMVTEVSADQAYMNNFHPEYTAMLDFVRDTEHTQNNLIDAKLEDILAIRRSLWT